MYLAVIRELEAELVPRQDECSELRNVLVSNTEDSKSLTKSNYSANADLESINENCELVLVGIGIADQQVRTHYI